MSKNKDKKNFVTPAQSEITHYSAPNDDKMSFDDLQQYLGPRKQVIIANDPIVKSRMGLNVKRRKSKPCEFELYDGRNVFLGVCARIQLDDVWKKVQRYEYDKTFTKPVAFAANKDVELKYGIKRDEWEKAKSTLSGYINRHKLKFFSDVFFDGKNAPPVLVQDVWQISEIEFLQLFINKSDCVLALLNAAVKAELAEVKALEKRWKKIKRYGYKVALTAQNNAVFNEQNAEILVNHGIRCLNDIRKYSALDIKNMFLSCNVDQLPELINAAFKEDYQCRLDVRLKVAPMVLGIMSLSVVFVIGLIYQYTLLKATTMMVVIIALLLLWASTVGLIIYGGIRAKKRRRTKRPDYSYFSVKFVRAFVVFVLLSVTTITSTTVFYERYDGYDNVFYYRNLKNGEITLAGLVDDETTSITVPITIDGKKTTKVANGAFARSKLQSVKMPNSIQELGASAFKNNSDLISVKISADLTQISRNAFKNCENLVTLSSDDGFENLQSIGSGAFENCKSLQSVSFPNVEYLGSNAFSGCESLSNADVFGNLITLESGVFRNCALSEVTLPSTVTGIGKNVFEGCELDSLTMPFLGTDISSPQQLIYFCDSVRNVTVLDSSVICDNAFTGIDNLNYVVLNSDGDIKLGKGAFENCSNLLDVTLPDGVTVYPDRLFKNCSSLTNLKGFGKITEVGKEAFYNCYGLKFSKGLGNLQSIGDSAFYGCSGLYSVDMSNVESLGENVFAGSGLINATFSTKFDAIPDGLFRDCKSLTTVGSLQNVEKICKNSFNGCSSLESFVLGDKVKIIEDGAFANCLSLSEFTVPNTVEEIGKNVFDGCKGLQRLTVPYIGKTLESSSKYSFKYFMTDSQFGYGQGGILVTVTDANRIYGQNFRDADNVVGVVYVKGVDAIEKGAFSGAKNLRSVDLTGINVIEAETFKNCKSLTTVSNASSVTEVRAEAFFGCDSLTNISLPSIITIEQKAFKGCFSLTDVKLSVDLQKIADEAFSECSSLNDMYIGTNVESIGKGVFYGCSSLNSVTFPYFGSSVNKPQKYGYFFNGDSKVLNITVLNSEKIVKDAFKNAQYLKTVRLDGDGVSSIGAHAFENCVELTTVVLSDKITEYPEGLFKNCIKLQSVSGFTNVTKVGNQAFYGCEKFNDESNLSNLKNIGKQAFYGCSGLRSVTLNSVSSLGSGAFEGCSGLVDIYIGKDLTTVPDRAFYACNALIEADGYESVTHFEKESFASCSSLENIMLPDGVKFIGKYAFADDTSLRSINIPVSVEKIGRGVIKGCDRLTSISVPFIGKSRSTCWWYTFNYLKPKSENESGYTVFVNDMKHIFRNSFKNSGNMYEVVLTNNTTQIDAGAFRSTKVKTVTLPSNTVKINKRVFENCSNLTTVYNVNNITELGKKAFYNCSALTAIDFPLVQTVGTRCFSYCNSLREASLPKLQMIDKGAFEYCIDLQDISLPKSLISIGDDAFRNCSELKSAVLPDSVEVIGRNAFRNSGLSAVTFGSGVKNVGNNAFRDCEQLAEVNFNEGLKNLGKRVFQSCGKLKTASLPSSLESIGKHCFYNCDSLTMLQTPYLGKTVKKTRGLDYFVNGFNGSTNHSNLTVVITAATKIDSKAFANCKYLYAVVFNKEITEMGDRIFVGCTGLRMVYLPAELSQFRDLIPDGVQIVQP